MVTIMSESSSTRARMEIRALPAEETAVRRYVEELWLPYHRELEVTVDNHALADDVDLESEEVQFRLDQLEATSHRAWVAVNDHCDERSNGDINLADVDGELAGFITTVIDESPTVFDQPDRLRIGDIYVRKPYRGTGLARELIDHAAEWASEAGCGVLTLEVDVDNERAIAFYEKLGFETHRRQMLVAVEEL